MTTEDNKTLVRRWTEEAWNKGNLSIVEEIYAATYVGHDPASPIGDPVGPEGAKQFVATYRRAFPDTHITIEQLVAEGDTVVSRFTARGTHNGPLMDLAPTGKPVTVTGIGISRVAGGKIVEEWTNYDALGMLQQLGAVPHMVPAGA